MILWDAVKAVLRRNFIAIQSYLRKQEKSQINNLNLCLKELEKENKQNLKLVEDQRRNKWNRDEETTAKINETKSWFFEKINNIEKPLARLIKKKRRGLKSIKLEMKEEKLQLTPQRYKES